MSSPNRILRLLKIVSLLQLGQPVTAGVLSEECGVSRRTIFRDIDNLRSTGLKIFYDADAQCYTFEQASFLLPTDLTVDEALALIVLCQDLADCKTGIPHLQPARTAAFKLASVLPRAIRSSVNEWIATHEIQIGPRANLEQTGQLFEDLRYALKMRHPLQIEYESFAEGEVIKTRLSPYSFYYGARSWYVIGRSSIHRQVRTFHLKRFRSATILTKHTYKIPARFSLDQFFGNAWRMIRNRKEKHHIVIEFSALVAGNVREVQWHRTQRIESLHDGKIHFHADVEGLSEIVWWILGYGDHAKVIEPEPLRNRIKQVAQKMVRMYRK